MLKALAGAPLLGNRHYSVCYHRAPPSIGVDGSDMLGGGADPCDDGVAVVTAVSRVVVLVVSRCVEQAASIRVRRILLMILIFMLRIRYACFVTTLCIVQSLHTELAELYSQKMIRHVMCLADF